MRKVWPWLQTLVGAGILGVLLWKLGTQSFVDSLRLIKPVHLFAAVGLGLGTTFASAWRWCLVARRLGLQLSISQAMSDYYRALFLNSVLPAGVLGDVHRAWKHGRQEGDLARGVKAVVLERTAGQIVLIVAGVFTLMATPALVPPGVRDIVWVVVAAIALLVVTLVVSRRLARRGSSLRRTLDDVRRGLFARETWPAVMGLSLAGLVGNITLFIVAADAVGLKATVDQLVPLALLCLLAMGLPLNIGGWGPREGVAALAFGAAGLGAAQGLATAVVYGVLALVAGLPGAGVLLLQAPLVRKWGKRYATSHR
ncbi:lysylphosphatidylglycerol synthase transmembrane domain-containing protein [Kibdelosporangium lantanae]